MPFRRLFGLAALALAFGCTAATDSPTPTSIAASPDPITLVSIGQTQQITASVKDQNGNTMSGQTITYSSNASGVASVSNSGLVTAVSSGNATITLAAAGLTEQVAVAVNQTANSINKTQGDGQTALENSTLPTQLRATVVDALGNAVAGVTVTFTIQGGGTLNDSTVNTNAQGHALVTWTLGSSANNQSVTATAGTLNATFTATAVSASSLVITKYVGDGQTALVGYATNIRPAVRVTTFGTSNGVPGVNVTFAVTGGGGSVQGAATVATNAQGYAQVQNWVVGGAPGANAMTATGAGTYPGGATVTFNATGAAAQYNIEIRNIGPAFSAPVQAAFNAAEAYWEQIIYGELSNVAINTTNACGRGATISETVDDIIVLALFDSIDGQGSVLGSAGWCSIRVSNGLPIYGLMRFDTADMATVIADGRLNALILHEMGHVLGFTDGSFNSNPAVTAPVNCAQNVPRDPNTGAGTNGLPSRFVCAQGSAVFDSIGGTSYSGGDKVPLENCVVTPGPCNAGTIYAHWREATFGNELMTGYVAVGSNPMSVLTIAALGDIGYMVNYAAAQAYTRTFTAPAPGRGTVLFLGDDVWRGPYEIVDDRTGRVIRVVQR